MSAQSPAVDASVIVCAFTLERWDDIVGALDSVRAQVPAPRETILVIDHAPALLERAVAAFPDVRVVPSQGPKGLSGARNTGVALARGQVVAFLDDDATADPGWLAALTDPYADPCVIGTGGWAEPRWDEVRPGWFPREFDWVVGCSYLGSPLRVQDVRNPLGCNMSFRRSVFEAVGDFRYEVGRVGRLPAGCEETEFCIRATREIPGARVVHTPAARVSHRVRAARGTWDYFRSRCYAEGRSKAIVTRLSGSGAGLSTERGYTMRTLPRGVLAGLVSGLHGDIAGLGRAAAIVGGLGLTTAGYLLGTLSLSMRGPRSATPDESPAPDPTARSAAEPNADDLPRLEPPVQVLEIEIGRPTVAVAPPPDGAPAGPQPAVALVRLHGAPLGFATLLIPAAGLPAAEVAAGVSAQLGSAIAAHLAADGLPPVAGLPVAGLAGPSPCLDALRAFAVDPPPLTVVIPTRDRTERLGACVEAILASGHPRLEVLVVDNGPSSDATKHLIADRFAGNPSVRYIRTVKAGVSLARNAGIRHASADVIVFLDDDVLVGPEFVHLMARPFAVDARVGCVTGMIVAAELQTWPQLWIEEYGGFGKGFMQRTFELAAPPPNAALFPYAAGLYGSGAAMAFRADALREFGGFDRALGGGTPALGGEDLAAFVDVILGGWRLVYEPRAIVRHFHHRESERLRRVMLGYGSGLGAYLTRLAVRYPSRWPDLAARGARGVAYVLNPQSAKNSRKRAGYPPELTRLELRGLVLGPWLYARGRRALQLSRRRSDGNGGDAI